MKKHNWNLSIIVPVYNAENTLKDCIESILNQTYEDFELILVDDGSKDASPELCDYYAEKDARICAIHTRNVGPFHARKLGAKKAKGEILTFSDADDWLMSTAFEEAMEIFEKENPDIYTHAYMYEDGETEKNLYEEGMYIGNDIREMIIPGMMFDPVAGGRRLNPSLCTKFVKKDLFMRVTESVRDRIAFGDDAIVTYPLVCMAERMFLSNKGLYCYRNHASSCTHTFPLKRIAEVRSFHDNIKRLFEKMGMLEELEYQAENYTRSFFAMMMRNWYGMELSPVMFCFPYNDIEKGSRVFIYGAGNVGKSYINGLKLTNYVEVAGWADENYKNIAVYNGERIIAPEHIKGVQFDVLLIAVWNEKTAFDIKKHLTDTGIPADKIVWKKPVRII